MKFAYLVTAGKKMALTFNKRMALRCAKKHAGNVYRMEYGCYKSAISPYPWNFWDRTTFIACSDLIYQGGA